MMDGAKVRKVVRAWRAQGLSYPDIQARCNELGYTTQLGTNPSLNTLNKWCKGVVKPRKPQRPKRPPPRSYDNKPRTFPPSLIIKLAHDIADERAKLLMIKTWHREGATLPMIRDRCIAHGITTLYGNTPSRSTLHRWVHEPELSTLMALQRLLGSRWREYHDELAYKVSKVSFR
jgi:hypothetical protein